MRSNSLDKFIALLSSDWFFAFWQMSAMEFDDGKTNEMRAGCRELVADFMGLATDYYQRSFSAERIQKTYRNFGKLLSTCGASDSTVRRVNALVESTDADQLNHWILKLVSEMLHYRAEDLPYLRPDVVLALRSAWPESIWRNPFTHLCLNSTSTWDRYLRNLTAKQPSMLADFLETEVLARVAFERIWHLVDHQFQPEQREMVAQWYQSAARFISGGELELRPPTSTHRR